MRCTVQTRWLALLLATGSAQALLLPPGPRLRAVCCAPASVMMMSSNANPFAEKKETAMKQLKLVREASQAATESQQAAEKVFAECAPVIEAAAERLAEAQAAVLQAEADAEAAEQVIKTKMTATQAAVLNIAEAEEAVAQIEAEQAEWEKEFPLEAAGIAGLEVAAGVGTAFMTSLFGEPKAVRLERERVEREAREKQEKIAAEKAEVEKAAAEKAAAEKAAAEQTVAEIAAAEKAAAEKAAAEKEESKRVAAERVDAEIRAKREEAEALLEKRRPRKLTESLSTAAVEAALAAAGSTAKVAQEHGHVNGLGAVAAWAAEQREKVRVEAAAQEKLNRLSLFESDLTLLGLQLEHAVALDEKTLRKAFRDRSKLLHPDVRGQQNEEQLEGIPSVYELNAAYETVRKLL